MRRFLDVLIYLLLWVCVTFGVYHIVRVMYIRAKVVIAVSEPASFCIMLSSAMLAFLLVAGSYLVKGRRK